MSKIRGSREKRHQPYWSHLFRGTPGNFVICDGAAAALAATNTLFQAANAGNLAPTNFDGAAGQLPSDETYRILCLRVGLYFMRTATQAGLNDFVFYHRALSQLYWELFVSSKSLFQAFTAYLPLGGGLHGDLGTSTDVYFNNGTPGADSACVLARSVALPARQKFSVRNYIIALGASNFLTDFGNLTAGEAAAFVVVDGLHVRDIL